MSQEINQRIHSQFKQQTDPKNSELAEWIKSIGIYLSDASRDDELFPEIAIKYCQHLGLDPHEIVKDMGGSCGSNEGPRWLLYEPMCKGFVLMMRAVYQTFSS